MVATGAPPTAVNLPTPRWFGVSLRAGGLLLGVVVACVVALLSLRFGSLSIATSDAWKAIFAYDPGSFEQTVVRSLRVPRTIIALGVGSCLAVAGASMQGVTRNPLADPSIFGVSSGASFAIAIAVHYLGLNSPAEYVWLAFLGALGTAALVFAVGSAGRDGATPVKLALSGIVISAMLGSWTSALLLIDRESLDALRFWLAGSVAGRDLNTFWTVSPFLLGGAIACLFLGHQLNALSLGDDTAKALGVRTGRIRLIASFLVVLITAAAVSAAGPIAFVGLAIPHVVRSLVGPDYRWVLPYSFVFGGVFLTASDILGRVVMNPSEIQVGIVTAIFGGPFMIYLARQRSVAS